MGIQRSSACLPMPSSTLSSFRSPSNPISNSPFWQLKMGWWKLCKCALFVMLFFCIHPHHVFITLQSSGAAPALVQKAVGSICQAHLLNDIYDLVTWIQLAKFWCGSDVIFRFRFIVSYISWKEFYSKFNKKQLHLLKVTLDFVKFFKKGKPVNYAIWWNYWT